MNLYQNQSARYVDFSLAFLRSPVGVEVATNCIHSGLVLC